MALILKGDIETNVGTTDSIHCKIDTITVNKSSGTIQYSILYWNDNNIAKGFSDLNVDSNVQQHTRNVINAEEILVYKDEKPITFKLPTIFRFKVVDQIKEMVPIFERQSIKAEEPYISFDENGDEITLSRTVFNLKEVKVGEEEIIKEIIKKELIENPWKESYKHLNSILKEEIKKQKVNLILEDN